MKDCPSCGHPMCYSETGYYCPKCRHGLVTVWSKGAMVKFSGPVRK
jgi:Zn finger protein HypA/HybF involved in hydrogenase expression